jgi:hypothetical protein
MQGLAAIGMIWLFAAAPQPELRPVDEGFEDVSPLASPSYQEPIDLRKPTDFEKVYEITTPSGETAFVRIDNGLVAIFNRSDYVQGTGDAFIPPNTRFHIGTHDLVREQSTDTYTNTPAAGRVNARPSTRISTRVPNGPRRDSLPNSEPTQETAQSTIPTTSLSGPPAIITNEYYRRLRITQLLQSAIAPE